MAKKAKKKIKHIGFEAAAESAAKSSGVSIERGRAMVAAKSRGASAAAKRRNPRLKKVRGKKK